MADETTTDRLAEIEGQAEPQPVQVREGRWRTRGGEIRNITPTPAHYREADRHSWHDACYYETWYPSGRYSLTGEHPLDLVEYLGPNLPEPDRIITPDDVAAEALAGVFDQGKAERQIAELRDEVSYVQGLLGEARKAVNSEARDKADLQNRLDTVAAEWAQQLETIRGLETQLEAVKAEVVQERLDRNRWHNQVLRVTAELDDKTTECRNLRIELDALQQAPQAEPVAAVPTSTDDRFEQGWDAGTARAVETIAEWTEPFRTCGSQALALAVLQNLPHIMRTLTGLAEED